ncbi:MAG: o-succinylbenzoate synthase [Scytonema sp. PMC 1069.18]|nr:o-succinylbenzoate synthase [Scytonema sp. PMC 1069.18]MEC4884887.1 o-succinylbenzoate synthase [Scytonema sp. PMC 1070.18]
MHYQFQFRPYRRRFVRSLTTSHGNWDVREGIILRLIDETGRVGWGEIAPVSWFGSETLEQALQFCRQLPEEIMDETIFSIPNDLPACQFGFESAMEWGNGEENNYVAQPKVIRTPRNLVSQRNRVSVPAYLSSIENHTPVQAQDIAPRGLTYSGLLPAGEGVLESWETLWKEGYRTFKWKIGVYPIVQELKIFESLIQSLNPSAKLRLDANGGLTYDEANLWLWTCDNIKARQECPVEIEFIEQPLSVERFESMLELSHCYGTAIALDESVATLHQLATCYHQGWRDIFVIKPSIVGSPSRLRQFCQQYAIDVIFSSVFETSIGRQAALKLAAELSRHEKAVGFGVNQWFPQEEETWINNLFDQVRSQE